MQYPCYFKLLLNTAEKDETSTHRNRLMAKSRCVRRVLQLQFLKLNRSMGIISELQLFYRAVYDLFMLLHRTDVSPVPRTNCKEAISVWDFLAQKR